MKKFCNFLVVVSIILFMANCSNNQSADKTSLEPKADSTSFDIQKAKSSILDINAKFSDELRKGDSAGLASHYTSDAFVMPPHSEPVPKDKIISAWGGAIRMGVKDIKLTTDDVTGNGEMLGETGKYEMYGANNKLLDQGKYVVVWKNENGEWKLYRDIWNTSMPAKGGK